MDRPSLCYALLCHSMLLRSFIVQVRSSIRDLGQTLPYLGGFSSHALLDPSAGNSSDTISLVLTFMLLSSLSKSLNA